jgi:hypothetical protein
MPVRYLFVVLVILACGCLQAGPCVPGTLFVYDNLPPAGCTVGNLTAFNFSFSVLSNVGVATPLNDTQITVTPTFGGPGGQLGQLNFASAGFSVGVNQSIQYLIAFTWDPHDDIQSMDDIMDPPFATNGLAKVTTLGCMGAAFVGSTCSTSTAMVMVFDDHGTTQFNNSTLITPSQILGIRNTITLQAGSGPGSGAGFDSFGSETRVPEPGTWWCCAAALTLLAARLRRLRARLPS